MKKPLKWTLWAVAALAVGTAGYAFLKPSKPQTTYLTEEVKAAWQRRVTGLHTTVVGMPQAGKPAARRGNGRRR